MVEKGIRGGICHVAHQYSAANNYLKNYDTDKNSSYLTYLDKSNLYRKAMSQILPVDGFKWKKKRH